MSRRAAPPPEQGVLEFAAPEVIEGLGDAVALVRSAIAQALRPDPRLTVSQWADERRMLTSKTTPEPGPWRTERVPYLREIMDSLAPSDSCERVVLMAGSQVGKTEAGLNWIGQTIDLSPGPMFMVQPTADMAKRFSKHRIDDLLESTPSLRGKVRERRERDARNTLLVKEFEGGILVIAGANSATGLRSMPAGRVFLDEVDAFPGDVDGEGDPVHLALTRSRNFGLRRKALLVSSPTIGGRSRIEREYLLSDCSQFHVPCPDCGHLQVITWANIRWQDDKPETVAFACVHCGSLSPEHKKTWMLANGRWIPSHPERTATVRGFHLSALYSPIGWYSWKQAAQEWLEIHGERVDHERLRQFVNTVLAETYKEKGEVPEWEALYRRRGPLERLVVPPEALIITAGADVQKDRIEVEVVAWGRGLESWSLDYRILLGDTSTDEPWKQLDALRQQTFEHPSGVRLPILMLAVDAGYNQNQTLFWTRDKPANQVMAVKGAEVPAFIGHVKIVDINLRGRQITNGARLWPVGVSRIKEELFGWLRQPPPLEKTDPFPRGFCHFPADYEKEYFQQLCGEELRKKLIRGFVRFEWEKIRDRNEALDCRVYARSAACAAGVDRWTDEDWDAVAAQLTSTSAPAAPERGSGDRPRQRGQYQGRFREWRGRKKT